MGFSMGGRPTRIAGRLAERSLVGEAVQRSSAGAPCAVIVHGEAGVGKTTLLAAVCEEAEGRGATVLWGRCVNFSGAPSPYLPLLSALEGWLEDTDDGTRDGLLAEVPGLADLLPSLGGAATSGAPAPVLIDVTLTRMAARAPTVLVVDDLHWADPASLDVLSFVLSGPRRRRLAVLLSYRDEELVEGHPLHGWLADAARAPSVAEVGLCRLTLDETRQQLELLLGRPPRHGLVVDVMRRSEGNPHLSELLVRGQAPEAACVASAFPDALRCALLAKWHRLSADGRRAVRLLAASGRPIGIRDLAAVAESAGMEGEAVRVAVGEAEQAGVVTSDQAGALWFRHPLLAEALTGSLPAGEEKRLHAAFVDAFERDPEMRTGHLADLAVHYTRAERYDEAFEASLRAAELAGQARAYAEEATLRAGAARLWPRLTPALRGAAALSEARLLLEASRAARTAGETGRAWALAERACSVVDRSGEPLVAAQALCLWGQALFDLGRVPQQPLEVFREAVDLSSSYPAGKEYAAALGALTEAETQQGLRTDAARHGDEAVAAARTCGEDGAVSLALGSRSAAHVGEQSAIGDADECHRLAVAAHDAELVGLACLARADALDGCGRLVESADTLLQALSPEAAHAPGGLGPVLAARAADLLVDLGRFDEARAMLQEAMTSGAGAGQVMIRALQAGIRLSLRTGHTEEAAALLGRLQEHAPGFERHIGAHGPAALAEYLTWSGAPDEALAVLWSTLERHTRAEPRYGDAMVWWAARAAADWATHGRDDRDPAMARAAVTALERILRLRERLPGWVPARDGEDRVQRANRELLDAESARCRGETASCRWQSAADAAGEAGLQWARADALLRLAQARLVEGRGRGEVGLPLRECHGLAAGLGATPLREEAESLSRLARISLAPASIPEQTRRRLSLLDGLTRRETEVLGHLVAGRSYQEIAQSLFISEKTVSVHVSNLLRKTGTTSRVEVAAYARRHGVDAAD